MIKRELEERNKDMEVREEERKKERKKGIEGRKENDLLYFLLHSSYTVPLGANYINLTPSITTALHSLHFRSSCAIVQTTNTTRVCHQLDGGNNTTDDYSYWMPRIVSSLSLSTPRSSPSTPQSLPPLVYFSLRVIIHRCGRSGASCNDGTQDSFSPAITAAEIDEI